jgi:hypothetical protein
VRYEQRTAERKEKYKQQKYELQKLHLGINDYTKSINAEIRDKLKINHMVEDIILTT